MDGVGRSNTRITPGSYRIVQTSCDVHVPSSMHAYFSDGDDCADTESHGLANMRTHAFPKKQQRKLQCAVRINVHLGIL